MQAMLGEHLADPGRAAAAAHAQGGEGRYSWAPLSAA